MMGQIQNIAGIFQNYYAAGFFSILMIAALLFLGYRAIKDKGAVRFLAAGSLIILILLFIPPFSTVIMKLIGEFVYWRVFWLVPSVIIVAAAGAALYDIQKKTGRKAIAALFCIAAIALSGKFMFTSAYYEPRENIYALPQEVVTIADAINADAKTRGEGFLKRIIAPTEIAVFIRVYDGTISQAYGRGVMRNEKYQGPAFKMVNSGEVDYTELRQLAKKLRLRYIVMYTDKVDAAAAEATGLSEIYRDDTYIIFINTGYLK